MLGFVAQWHRISVQSAYKLWQLHIAAVPPPPANQWMSLEGGMPMGSLDQCIADAEVPQLKAQILQIDLLLSAAADQ